MGFFSQIASEARQGMTCEQDPMPGRQAAISPPPAASERKPASPAVAPVSALASSPSPTSASAPEPTPSPTPASSPVPTPTTSPTPTLDLSSDADAADEAERKRAHEAAEAKRKAEWEAKQATKRAAEKEQLDKLAAMTDEAAIAAAVNQVHAATDRMTNRSMKDSVSAHIQALCRADPAFARLTMHPRKSMLHCIQYIYARVIILDFPVLSLLLGVIRLLGLIKKERVSVTLVHVNPIFVYTIGVDMMLSSHDGGVTAVVALGYDVAPVDRDGSQI